MLIQFSDRNGSRSTSTRSTSLPYREEKHFGRPGVGTNNEYRDTLILTTKGEFNVQDSPDDVVREVNRAFAAMLDPLKPTDAAASSVLPPGEDPAYDDLASPW